MLEESDLRPAARGKRMESRLDKPPIFLNQRMPGMTWYAKEWNDNVVLRAGGCLLVEGKTAKQMVAWLNKREYELP